MTSPALPPACPAQTGSENRFRHPVLALIVSVSCVTGCEQGAPPEVLETEVVRHGGRIYTPLERDTRGCLRYSMEIPGGVAPTALYHRLRNGSFVIAHDGTDCAGATPDEQ